MKGKDLIRWIQENQAEDLQVFRQGDYGDGNEYEVEDVIKTEHQWTGDEIIYNS